jgi:spore coat polysaccharide biosynthesis predicted glycosyltransferase SpsG
MRFVIHADASKSKGAGHVMRLLPLAQELISRQFCVVFVGDISELSWLSNKLKSIAFAEFVSEASHFKSNPEQDILILDSYEKEKNSVFVQNKNWKFVVLIADELTPKFEADLVIHPGIGGKWIDSWNRPVLYGLSFTLIRDSLKLIERKFTSFNQPVIAILPGGTDAFGISDLIVTSLEKVNANFTCYVPSSTLKTNLDSRFIRFEFGDSIEKILGTCTGVISTASTTSLEIIFLNIPLAILSITKNQDDYYDSLVERNLVQPLGKFDGTSNIILLDSDVAGFVTGNLEKFSKASLERSLIDGLGAHRVTEAILSCIEI